MAFMEGHAKPPRNVKRAQNIHGTHSGDFTPKAPCSSASKAPKNDMRDKVHRKPAPIEGGGALGRSVRHGRAQPRG